MATAKERLVWRCTFEALASSFLARCQGFTGEMDEWRVLRCPSPELDDAVSLPSTQDKSSCLAPLPHITGAPRRRVMDGAFDSKDVSECAIETKAFLPQRPRQTAVRRAGAAAFHPVHRMACVVASNPSDAATSTFGVQAIHHHARRALARHTTTQYRSSTGERVLSPPIALRRVPCIVPPGPTNRFSTVHSWLPVGVQPPLSHSRFLSDSPVAPLSSIVIGGATIASVSIDSDEADLVTCEGSDYAITCSSVATTTNAAATVAVTSRLSHCDGMAHVPATVPPVVPHVRLQVAVRSITQSDQLSADPWTCRAKLSPLRMASASPQRRGFTHHTQPDRVAGTEVTKPSHPPPQSQRCSAALDRRYG